MIKYWGNLDLKNYTDNKKFFDTMKPLFSKSVLGKHKITLVENSSIINEDKEVAEKFNDFFITTVSSLAITENKALLTDFQTLMIQSTGLSRNLKIILVSSTLRITFLLIHRSLFLKLVLPKCKSRSMILVIRNQEHL